MNRREFLRNTGALAATSALLPTFSLTAEETLDWSSAWRSVPAPRFSPVSMTLHGELPADVRGTLFRNGPALNQRGEQRTQHWFDGDGMIQRFRFDEKEIVHDGNMVMTDRFVKEQEAGAFLFSHAGTYLESGLAARNNDTTNPANIALLPWQDELLALWEGGSAYRVDPQSLETLGRKDWRDDLVHMPFSAHPLTERDGSIWNFGFAPYAGKTGRLFVYHLSPKQGVRQVQPVTLPFAGYIHDFAQTQSHLIFVLPPLIFKHGHGNTYVDSFKWQPELGSRMLVMDKDDLSKQRWFELPSGFVFHFGSASQSPGQLHVNLCWYKDASLFQSTREQRIEQQHMPLHKQAFATTLIADLNTGKCDIVGTDTVLEFPGFDTKKGQASSRHIGVGVVEKHGIRTDTLTFWDAQTGQAQHYAYPAHCIAEEPLQISGKSQRNDYILQTYFDIRKQQTGLNLFHSQHISDGPMLQASMERALPLGFHGVFIG